jgi:hypothetical protein
MGVVLPHDASSTTTNARMGAFHRKRHATERASIFRKLDFDLGRSIYQVGNFIDHSRTSSPAPGRSCMRNNGSLSSESS